MNGKLYYRIDVLQYHWLLKVRLCWGRNFHSIVYYFHRAYTFEIKQLTIVTMRLFFLRVGCYFRNLDHEYHVPPNTGRTLHRSKSPPAPTNIRHFRVALCAPVFKTSLSAKMSLICMKMNLCAVVGGNHFHLNGLEIVWLIPRSHQSLNMFKSCLVKHGLKLFSL